MSHQSQSVQTQAQPSTTLSPEIINALTEKLGELVAALTTLNQEETPEPNSESASEEAPKKQKDPDKIRCYHIPAFIARYEDEALTQYQAENLLELLRKARDDFYLTSILLQRFHEENELNGFLVQQIGERLDYPIRMLNDLCGIFADYKQQKPEPNPDC